MNLHLWIIPLLPLLGAAMNGFLGRRLPRRLVTLIALGMVAASLAASLWVAASLYSSGAVTYTEEHVPWIQAGGFTAGFTFFLDHLSVVMILVVTGVGFLIHVYAVGYMAEDKSYWRFFSYLNLFMFFMLMLVLASNYLLMFVGWEGVGLASYLLIGFYYSKPSAVIAGKKAFVVNRVGDFGFMLAMFLMIKLFGSLDFEHVMRLASSRPVETGHAGVLTAIALLLLLGATGKSAQIPLYVWLPDAMEGPTPVSALIHAATMVTAGVYMVARSHVIFSHSPYALAAVAAIGCITSIFAATIGMVQTDIKRVLAYSTISQLGYMFLAAGVAAYSSAVFHLMTHAFFKALLFLSAGSVIHAMAGEQDMRHMGGLRKQIPWTFAVMTVGTLAIAGTPMFSGFFSKDEILWKTWSSGNHLLWAFALTTAAFTSFYMFRLWFMTFFGESRKPHAVPTHGGVSFASGHAPSVSHGSGEHAAGVHESPWIMLAPLVLLAVLSVVGGYIGIPRAFGGQNHFERFLAPVFSANISNESPALESSPAESANEELNMERSFAAISVGAGAVGFYFAWLFYYKRRDLPDRFAASLGGIYRTVLHKYYVDEAYQSVFVRLLQSGARRVLWRGIDVGLIDTAVNQSGAGALGIGSSLRKMQSGSIRSYAGWIVLGAAGVITYMLWVGPR